jgi:alpha-L-rhamnosidase
MEITSMKCNGVTAPIGFDLTNLMLRWTVDGEGSDTIVRSRVQIATDAEFRTVISDTQWRVDLDARGYFPALAIRPTQRYFWKLMIETANGSELVKTSFFESGKSDGLWTARWIKPSWQDNDLHPLFRSSIDLRDGIDHARAYVCGLGLYEMYVNGVRAGDEYLTPDCNAYDQWIQHQTYDLTDVLSPGRNVIASLTGNGWYRGRFTFSEEVRNIYGDEFAFLMELHVHYKDGSEDVFVTDGSWKNSPGFIRSGNIYDGEVQDLTQYPADWKEPDFDDSTWAPVAISPLGTERVVPRRSLPVRIMQRITPQEIFVTPKGETVLDMGQNMVGWLEMDLSGIAPSTITLQYGELLQEGCFFNENLRSAKARFVCSTNGDAGWVRPYFTFYGFRYVKIDGFDACPDPGIFVGCVLYSEMETTGHIETSNPLVNRLFENAMWGQKGNFLDVPTDCPQRDERMGWTGDAQIFCSTACMNMDADAFFRKYTYDMWMEQQSRGGNVPQVVPMFRMDEIFRGMFSDTNSAAWGDAATIIPWTVYLHYGDRGILEDRFESMKAWADLIHSLDDGNRLWDEGFHFGDWLASDVIDKKDPFGATAKELIASAFYEYSTRLVAKAAAVLGKDDIARRYHALADEIKTAIQQEFITRTGRLAVDTQTGYVLMLAMDLAPEEFRPKFAKALADKIIKNNYHIHTGFVGTPYILNVLTANGYNDVAYRMLLNEEMPGWLYPVKMGATTIWERWNSILPDGRIFEVGMTSLNHYAYGSIAEWMYRDMCGINPDESAPGYKKILLRPNPDPLLRYARAEYDSVSGRIISGWEYTVSGLRYHCRVPSTSTAVLHLPCKASDTVLQNGLSVCRDLKLSPRDALVIPLGPGEHVFEIQTAM